MNVRLAACLVLLLARHLSLVTVFSNLRAYFHDNQVLVRRQPRVLFRRVRLALTARL
jgi:hypothetical protein